MNNDKLHSFNKKLTFNKKFTFIKKFTFNTKFTFIKKLTFNKKFTFIKKLTSLVFCRSDLVWWWNQLIFSPEVVEMGDNKQTVTFSFTDLANVIDEEYFMLDK